jgi:hypothetical protein
VSASIAFNAGGVWAIYRSEMARTARTIWQSVAHLRQLEILTHCFTSTFRAGKATWHYITLSGCILELRADLPLILRRDDRCRTSAAALVGREGPESRAKVRRRARGRFDARDVTPTDSRLWIEKSN